VEDLIPGSEYTLEVSSPGLDRKLYKAADYERFQGSLVKLQTFTPVNGNRHWNGRLQKFAGGVLTLDLTAVKQKGKAKKTAAAQTVEIGLANVEKAQLVPEVG
jgi:ribosome maturation factor RimP